MKASLKIFNPFVFLALVLDFAVGWVSGPCKLILQCNSMHAYAIVSLTVFNGAYSHVSVHKIAAFIPLQSPV